MEDISYTDGYAAQYDGNYGSSGYGYGEDLGTTDYNPYGTDYDYDMGGYGDYGNYGDYYSAGDAYGNATDVYGGDNAADSATGTRDPTYSLKLEDPLPAAKEEGGHDKDQDKVITTPLTATIDDIPDHATNELRTSSAFPPVSNDLLESIRVQQELSSKVSKISSGANSRTTSRPMSIRQAPGEKEADSIKIKDDPDKDAGDDAADVGTQEQPADDADDMFGFGTSKPATATATADEKTAEPTALTADAIEAADADDMFGFGVSEAPATSKPTEAAARTIALAFDDDDGDMFGFGTMEPTQPTVLAESEVHAEPEPETIVEPKATQASADDLFSFGTEEPATIEPAQSDEAEAATGVADDMFGFGGADTAAPTEQQTQLTEMAADIDDMLGFGDIVPQEDANTPATSVVVTAEPQTSPDEDLFGFGTMEDPVSGQSEAEAELEIELEKTPETEPKAAAESLVVPSAPAEETEEPQADDLFGFGVVDDAPTEAPLVPEQKEEPVTDVPESADNMFGFGDSVVSPLQSPAATEMPVTAEPVDDMFGFGPEPTTDAPQADEQPPETQEAVQEEDVIDETPVDEEVPDEAASQIDLLDKSPEVSQKELIEELDSGLAEENIEEQSRAQEQPQIQEQPEEPPLDDMFGFGDVVVETLGDRPENEVAVKKEKAQPAAAAPSTPPKSPKKPSAEASLQKPAEASAVPEIPVVDTMIDIDSMLSLALALPPPAPVEEEEPQVLEVPVLEEKDSILRELPEDPTTSAELATEISFDAVAKQVEEDARPEEDTADAPQLEDPVVVEPEQPKVPLEILEHLAVEETFIKLEEELQGTYELPEMNKEKLALIHNEEELAELRAEAQRLFEENQILAGRSKVPRCLHRDDFDDKSVSVSFFEGLLGESTNSEGLSLTVGEELRLLALLEQADDDAVDDVHKLSYEELQLMEERERELNMKLTELTQKRDELLFKNDDELLKTIEDEIWAFIDAEEEKKLRFKAAEELRIQRIRDEEAKRRAEIESRIKEEQECNAEERRLRDEMLALQSKQMQEATEREAKEAELKRTELEKQQLARIREEQELEMEAKRRLIEELETAAEHAAEEDKVRIAAELEEMERIKRELEEAVRTESEEKRKMLLQKKEQLEKEMEEAARRHEEAVSRRQMELETLQEERRKLHERRLASSEPMDEPVYTDEGKTDSGTSYATLDLERRIREMKARLEREMAEKMAIEQAGLSALESELTAKKKMSEHTTKLLSNTESTIKRQLDQEERAIDEAVRTQQQELALLEKTYNEMKEANKAQRTSQQREYEKTRQIGKLTERVTELSAKKHDLKKRISHSEHSFAKKESKLLAANNKSAVKTLQKQHKKEVDELREQLSKVSAQLDKSRKQLDTMQHKQEQAERCLSVKDYVCSVDKDMNKMAVSDELVIVQPQLSALGETALGTPSLVSGQGLSTSMSGSFTENRSRSARSASPTDLPATIQKLREEHAHKLEKIEQRRAAFAQEREQLRAQKQSMETELLRPEHIPDSRLRTKEQRKQIIFAEMDRMEKLSKMRMINVAPQIPEKTPEQILNERRKRHDEERSEMKNIAERFTSAYDKHSRVVIGDDSSDDEWNDLAANVSSRHASRHASGRPRMQAKIHQLVSDRIDPEFNSYLQIKPRPGFESVVLSCVKISSDPSTCHPTKFVARLVSHTWCIEHKNKPYVVYTFVVSTERGVFEITKRFSELKEFDKTLHKIFPTVTLPQYPTGSGGAKLSNEQLEERKQLLARYMAQLNKISVVRTSTAYREFMHAKISHNILNYHR